MTCESGSIPSPSTKEMYLNHRHGVASQFTFRKRQKKKLIQISENRVSKTCPIPRDPLLVAGLRKQNLLYLYPNTWYIMLVRAPINSPTKVLPK
jgi:hypothetical protein